ncbi:hypothetical protein DYU05_03430 [Mucilaginibacter terrenus]|uniref:Fructosamine kinase family protein n=1 Tax=Mucilaginibacter terrenus TaxID=2482727 RepID=A0A3E2NUI6_9SPHI|nr:fructosamine kinase family protein [Mucilaginibacter terrenus]RFZ84673.1 hypothetical protein DYU05_03430 [Mucilaginibacter terrenus]
MPVITIIKYIEDILSFTVNTYHAVSGGDINQAYQLNTSRGKYFLKVNSFDRYPYMFLREKEGLEAISASQTIKVPEVILQSEVDSDSFLLLEWIDSVQPTNNNLRKLGEQLAKLHKVSNEHFGFSTDNFIGSLHQANKINEDWTDFFIEERIAPLLRLAFDARLLSKHDVKDFEELHSKLPDIYPKEQPALVHGDLWGGNYLINNGGNPYLIDPAVYYGNREMDIATTKLFGGFGDVFYEGYNTTYPLQPGWEQRVKLWNLYPLLVHVNLFGGTYVHQLQATLRAALVI